MRRLDRAVTDPAALFDILTRCRVARLGLCRGGVPYVVPMNFACERQDGRFVFYVHCANEGQKLDILRENANVCIEADCDHALVPGEQACSHSYRYASVIAQGRAEVLQDAEEKARAYHVHLGHVGRAEGRYADAGEHHRKRHEAAKG